MARVLTPHADGRVGPVEGVDVRVGLGYWPEDSVIARWDMARWDQPDALWAGAAPIEDISQHVITIRTSRGRDFPLERFRPGTATVVIDDPEGRYSPWNTAHDPSTYATVRPGVDLHVWTEHADDVYRLFAGAVNRIADDWEGADDDEHRVTFTAVDYLGELAAYDGLEQAPAGAGERAGARVNRVLDSAANPRARALDDGQVALQPTTLAKNALDEIGMVCDTELGAFLCMADGSLALLDRARLVSDIHFTDVQAVFGDEPGELCYVDLTLSSDTDKVKNVVSIANEGGAAITRTDPTSVSLYRPQTFRRFDLIHVDPAESIEIADEHLALFAYAANRIESLVVSPSVHDDVVPAVLALGLLYRIELRRRASGFQVVAQLQIQAIDHEIDADTWNITYKTFTARAVAHGGRWDRARWDVGLWGYYMGHIADVVANTPITSAWGNAIRDHATMVYDSAAQRTAQWIAPPVGAMSYLVDQPGKLWVYEAGAWQVLVDRNHGTAVIAEQTLAIDGTISILAIPQTYTHLRLTVSGRGAAAVNLSTVLLRINGDAAANYDTLYLTGVGGGSPSAQSAQVLAGTTMGVGAALGNTGTAGRGFATEILLFDYRGGTYQKDVRAISNVLDAAFTGRAQQESGHWRSAAAITQLDLHHNVVGTGWKAGTRWTLEGIR